MRKATDNLKIDYEFKTQKPPNPKVFTYFYVDINDFRCFKIANFIGLAAGVAAHPGDGGMAALGNVIFNSLGL
ncbi:hypothetical protein [Chryseobacterium artocarpi]|uniref:hypothetical protein n=1 Tax=Chryseobacterium artocarpi TaxID=1414727 RepID=UPI003F68BC19